METRKATITEVKWQRPGNPWKRVVTDDVTRFWTGPLGDVVPGTIVECEGEEEKHPRFGVSFVVQKVLSVGQPAGASAEQWIALRLPEIGERRASQLVEQYEGDELWDALSDPAALTQLRGITHDRAAKIVETFNKRRDEAIICCFLADHQLPLGLAIKAYDHFKGDFASVVDANPYDLISIPGITFETIDTCALSLGWHPQSPERIRAMAESQLEQNLAQGGHCFEKKQGFILRIAKAVGLPFGTVADILWVSMRLTLREGEILLRRIDVAEQRVADAVRTLRHAPERPLPEVELPEWLDPSQKAAVEGLLTRPVAVLTGGPGTGKTTTLKAALDALEARGARIRLASPTGKAAKRAAEVTGRPATTIHKLLEWHPEGWRRTETNPVEADVVVIDETSMVDIELAEALLNGVSSDTQLIFVGDVDQLPPVGPGQPFADLIGSGKVPTFRLTTTHRQAGENWVVDNATKIIRGESPSLKTGGGFEHLQGDNSDVLVEAVIELYREFGAVQVLTPEHKNGAGTVRLNLAVQEAVNPNASAGRFADHVKAGGYQIYVGDRVLYTRNNPDQGLVNGDMGELVGTSLDAEGRAVAHVRFEGITHVISDDGQESDVWQLAGGDLAPLTLAYAMTVHKAQGSEWPHVVVIADPAHWSLSRRLLYTAVTRTSDRLTLVGAADAVTRATKNTRGLERRTLLQQRLRGELG